MGSVLGCRLRGCNSKTTTRFPSRPLTLFPTILGGLFGSLFLYATYYLGYPFGVNKEIHQEQEQKGTQPVKLAENPEAPSSVHEKRHNLGTLIARKGVPFKGSLFYKVSRDLHN